VTLVEKEHIAMSEAEQEEKHEITLSVDWHIPVTSFKITTLPEGRSLTRPLEVRIAYDDGEVIISEPHFHIHAVGTTLTGALAEFKLTLLEELDELTSDENELGSRLLAELQYLRGLIRTA